MSGRGITASTVRRTTPHGIYTRLASHASGRRSGDQFCVYVADRLVLPTSLPTKSKQSVQGGTKSYAANIHENLRYRFVTLPDGAAAYAIESAIKHGKWEHGRPLLNPGK